MGDACEDEHRCNVHVRRNSNRMGRKEINGRLQKVEVRRAGGRVCGLHPEAVRLVAVGTVEIACWLMPVRF